MKYFNYKNSVSALIKEESEKIENVDIENVAFFKMMIERYEMALRITRHSVRRKKIITQINMLKNMNTFWANVVTDSSKIREIYIDENITEREFVEIISELYKQEFFIYAIIPEWEEELLNILSNQFVLVKNIILPNVFPKSTGYVGFVKDSQKQFVYEFYLRSMSMAIVFSDEDVSKHLDNTSNENIDIHNIFESNEISHITIGSDGGWLNITEY
ncbi:hypothetical protein MHH33_09070 [Paenisporosarcina sp. FSL H8-0542]|uniref:hypothetical protein n=1 Tax=Paenisporosarcina sp. FSL H8-0542 TaxID=2921401 RepID=UPI00315A2D7D